MGESSSQYLHSTMGVKPKEKKRLEHMDLQQKQAVRRKFFEQFYDIIA